MKFEKARKLEGKVVGLRESGQSDVSFYRQYLSGVFLCDDVYEMVFQSLCVSCEMRDTLGDVECERCEAIGFEINFLIVRDLTNGAIGRWSVQIIREQRMSSDHFVNNFNERGLL